VLADNQKKDERDQFILAKKINQSDLFGSADIGLDDGFTYEINGMYHTCLCILFATLEMQRYSLEGISCCMGFGDYPIQF
jgi:hypothetical protein